MNPAVRRSRIENPKLAHLQGPEHSEWTEPIQSPPLAAFPATATERVRVFVAAEDRVLRETISRMLSKNDATEFVGADPKAAPFRAEMLLELQANIFVLVWGRSRTEDLALVQHVRATAPDVRILLLGMTLDQSEFLQCVRAGVSGYLLREASLEHLRHAIRAIHTGEAVCPGALNHVLFHYIHQEACLRPSATVHTQLGLSRREQQLIPLVARGLTNKEIANHFCLSEQTVKNHIYRIRTKVGAENRLGIVQIYRTHGFLT